MQEGNAPESRRRQLAVNLLVPLVLLLALGGWFWLSRAVARPPAVTNASVPTLAATSLAGTSRPLSDTTATGQDVGLVGLATPWGAAGLEPAPTATLSVVAPGTIALFGPPTSSRFRAADIDRKSVV